MTWPTMALSGLVSRVDTSGPDPARVEFTYVDLSAVNSLSKTITQKKTLSLEQAPSRARQRLATGDVLVSTVRPNLNSVAQVQKSYDGAIASTGFCVLRPHSDKLCDRFLFHWTKSSDFIGEMTRLATGASYPAVSDAIVKASVIPLPPLPEQRRIAAILDQADELRTKRRRSIRLCEELTDSLFIEMFGDPLHSLQSPNARRLEDIVDAVVDCAHTTPIWVDSGVVCLRTPNLVKGDWDFSETRFVSEATHTARTKRSSLDTGDIVLSREGTVGVGAIVGNQLRASMGQRLVQIKPNMGIATSEFLLAYLMEVLQPERLSRLLVGSTAKHINVSDLRALRVLVPPLERQALFEARMVLIRDELRRYTAELRLLDNLFLSLQHSAFRGDL